MFLVIGLSAFCQTRVTQETAARIGELLGAQILIRGVVTGFEEKIREGGALGIKLPFGIGAGAKVTQAYIAIDLRIYDTSSGEVIAATNIEKKPRKVGLALTGITEGGLVLGGAMESKTPLGQALRDCIGEAIDFIIKNQESVLWQARVVRIKDGKMTINAGSKEDVEINTIMDIYCVGERLIDPETGQILGIEEEKIGSLNIVDVKEKYSIGELIEGDIDRVKRGDICRLTKDARKIVLKKRIAVSSFEVKPGVPGVGNELSDVLTTELVKTGKFVVLERKELDAILREQELSREQIPQVKEEKLPIPTPSVYAPGFIFDIIPDTLPDGEIVDLQPEFSWPHVKGTHFYKITVGEKEGGPVWSVAIPGNITSIVYGYVPEGGVGTEVKMPLKPNTEYRWFITAVDRDDKVIALGGGKFRTKKK